jgi:uncharacterized membrane protein
VKRQGADLVATAALAFVSALVIAALPGPDVLRTIFAVPLVAVLPGYSLTAALFAGRQIDWARRFLLTIGLSLSVSIVAGVVLNLFPFGLRSWSWTGALVIVTCAGCVVAAERRRGESAGPASPPARSIPQVRVRDLGVVLAALVVFGGAIAYGRTPLAAKNASGYSAVWLLPGFHGDRTTVRVGVTSAEKQARTYRLILRKGSKVIYQRRFALTPGGDFATVVKIGRRGPRSSMLVASLYLRDRPTSVYRVARLLVPKANTP